MKNKKHILSLAIIFTFILGFANMNALANSRTTSSTVKSITDFNVKVNQNTKYVLPTTVVAVMTNGSKKNLSIKWNVSSGNTSKPGTYYYYGTVSGYSKKVKLSLVINPVNTYRSLYSKSVDVDGDKKSDTLQVLGSIDPFLDDYTEEIKVLVRTSNNKEFSIIQKEFIGFLANVYVGDFNGDKKNEIVIIGSCGGSMGTEEVYIYTINEGKLQYSSFDPKGDDLKVTFMDNYQLTVSSEVLNKEYLLSFTDNKDDYEYEHRGIYINGKLKDVDQLFGLGQGPYYSCEDIDKDGVYEIIESIDIDGTCNGDTLGIVKTYIKNINGKWMAIDLKVTQ
jgi:hypothetical protein